MKTRYEMICGICGELHFLAETYNHNFIARVSEKVKHTPGPYWCCSADFGQHMDDCAVGILRELVIAWNNGDPYKMRLNQAFKTAEAAIQKARGK